MLNFTPRRGVIILCDYDMANVPPEMPKRRRVVVMSPKSYNEPGPVVRGGASPGKCIVVPFSATEPRTLKASHVYIPVGRYKSLTEPVWAIGELLGHVSHTRLDRIQESGVFLSEYINAEDLAAIEEAVRHALGIPSPIVADLAVTEMPDKLEGSGE